MLIKFVFHETEYSKYAYIVWNQYICVKKNIEPCNIQTFLFCLIQSYGLLEHDTCVPLMTFVGDGYGREA